MKDNQVQLDNGYDDQGDTGGGGRVGGYSGFDPPSLVSGQLTVQFQKYLLQWNPRFNKPL